MQVKKILNRRHNLVGTTYCAKRHVTAGNPLGHGHQVRLNFKMLDTEHLPRAAKTTNYLVNDEQDIVFAADLPHNGPILLGRCIGPVTLHDRFSDKC